MKTALPGWLPDAGTELEAVIREARRRQRRRWLAAGVAMVTVVAGAAAVIAGSGAGSRPRPPGSPTAAPSPLPTKPPRLTGQPPPRGASGCLLLGGHRPAWPSVPPGPTEQRRGRPPRRRAEGHCRDDHRRDRGSRGSWPGENPPPGIRPRGGRRINVLNIRPPIGGGRMVGPNRPGGM